MNFANLGAFSRHMALLAVKELAIDTIARGGVAAELHKAVREKIGGDPAGLPPPLAASTVEKKGHDLPLYESGKLHDSIQWEHVSARKTIVASDDPKAVWHELGPTNGRFPRRSFLASTANEKNMLLLDLYTETLQAFLAGSRMGAAVGMSVVSSGVSRIKRVT